MKVLIVGSEKQWAIENFYHKYLNELGAATDIYPIHDRFYDFYYKHILNKLLFKAWPRTIYHKLNKELLSIVAHGNYDVIWVFKGMEIYPDTFRQLQRIGPKLVNFNPDHPFFFSGKGSGNKNVLEAIGLYDLHFCYHSGVMQKIQGEYNIPCQYLPFGYNPTNVKLPTEDKEIRKACFIGNPDHKRVNYLQHLIDNGTPLDVYGNDWSKYLMQGPETSVFPAIYGEELNKLAPTYRVQLNIFRAHNEGSHNMRTFEMPGMGCVMVTPFSEEQQHFFRDKKEVFYYFDLSHLNEVVRHILDMPYNKSMEIRKNALKRSIDDAYDYSSRTNKALNMLKEAFNTTETIAEHQC